MVDYLLKNRKSLKCIKRNLKMLGFILKQKLIPRKTFDYCGDIWHHLEVYIQAIH